MFDGEAGLRAGGGDVAEHGRQARGAGRVRGQRDVVRAHVDEAVGLESWANSPERLAALKAASAGVRAIEGLSSRLSA